MRKIIEPLPELISKTQGWIKKESLTPAVDLSSKKLLVPYGITKNENAQRLHEYSHILFSIPKEKILKNIKDYFLIEAINYIEDIRVNLLLCNKRIKDISYLLKDEDIEKIKDLIENSKNEIDPIKKSYILMFLAYIYLNTYILYYEGEENKPLLENILKLLIENHLQNIEINFLNSILKKLYKNSKNQKICKKLAVLLSNFYRPKTSDPQPGDSESKKKNKSFNGNKKGNSNLDPYELQGKMNIIKLNKSNYTSFNKKPAKSDFGYKIRFISNYLINKRIFEQKFKNKFKNKAVILFDISGSMSFNEDNIKQLMMKYKENIDIYAYHGNPKTHEGYLYEIAINGNLINQLPSTGKFNVIDLLALKYIIDKYKREKRKIIYYTDENYNGYDGKSYEQIDIEIFRLIRENNVYLVNPDKTSFEKIIEILERMKK